MIYCVNVQILVDVESEEKARSIVGSALSEGLGNYYKIQDYQICEVVQEEVR